MERDEALRIVEALLYMTDHALSEKEIVEILDMKSFKPGDVREMIAEIGSKLRDGAWPLEIVEVAGGFQMATASDVAPFVRRLYRERLTVRLSPSALETLAIIAYKQPIAKAEIEQIRGVEVSGVMETLLERRLVKVVGRKETIGRPLLYGTSQEFLRHFGLRSLSDLPELDSISPAELPHSDTLTVDEEAPESPLPADAEEAPRDALVPAGVAEEAAPDALSTEGGEDASKSPPAE